MGYKLKFRIIIIFLTVFYRVDLFAFECKVLEKTGSATFEKLNSDDPLKTVLSKFKKFQNISIKNCDVGEPIHKKGSLMLRARFHADEMTVVIDSEYSIFSIISVITKLDNESTFDTEIEVYVRSESEKEYNRLLYSVIDKSETKVKLSIRYNHDEFKNQKRYLLISLRLLGSDNNIKNIRRLLFLTYKDRLYPVH